MYILKRDGRKQDIHFDKITERIKKLANREPVLKNVDPIVISQKVVAGLYSGVTTVMLDQLACETSIFMSMSHPDYGLLASRLAISNLHKSTSSSYSDTCDLLYNHVNKITGKHAPLLSEECYKIIKNNIDVIEQAIDYNKDYDYEYFGFKTLEKAYLLKINGQIIERIQHMHMRVAIGIHKTDIKNALESYRLMSEKFFIHATPTLYNSGTQHPSLSSCFLLQIKEDSVEGIYDTLKQCALISKACGGVGLSIHDVRAKGSYIESIDGHSEGIIPMLRTFNDTAKHITQGSKRKGSFAIYLEPHHAEIEEFLELKRNNGNEDLRCRDLFLGCWISDLFMSRVEKNLNWSLFCPNEAPGLSEVYGDEFVALYEKYEREGKAKKVIRAQDLWFKIMDTIIETSSPYIMYKDAVNRHNNQSNLGTIKSSNLCVSGDTFILTNKGQIPIKNLVDQDVIVWNGEEWSDTTIRQTGTNQELVKVILSNGVELKCTPYHKFYLQEGYKNNNHKLVTAIELKPKDNLIKYELPILNLPSDGDMKYAYTHGFFCGDGTTYDRNRKHTKKAKAGINEKIPKIYLYAEKKLLLEHVEHISYTESKDQNRYNLVPPRDLKEKFYVPLHESTETQLRWFEGYTDADGTIARNGTNESIQIACINKDFLLKVKLMLQLMGVDSKVTKNRDAAKRLLPDHKGGQKEYDCKEIYRLLIHSNGLYKLSQLGYSPKRLKFKEILPQRDCTQFIKVISVEKLGQKEDTYCFTEPKRNMGMFNGILAGNCSEIVQYTSEKEVAVCNLASICLQKCVVNGVFDHQLLYDVVYHVVGNLNKVIDETTYPLPEAKYSNLKNRPIGLGVQGLANTFFLLRYPFDSKEAKQLNQEIFETMYFAAATASCHLAKINGPYESFPGSPTSRGILCHDSYQHTPTDRWNFNQLRKEVVEYGLRNSLLLSVQPTASSAGINASIESIEAQTSNMYARSVLAGEFIMVNNYLVQDLIDLGLWNENMKNQIIINQGSVQAIKEIPDDIKLLYRTVWEISQKEIIDMGRSRQVWIDQSQSMNVFLSVPTRAKLTSLHFYSWKQGVKTSSYYVRTKPGSQTIQFTVDQEIVKKVEEESICESCM